MFSSLDRLQLRTGRNAKSSNRFKYLQNLVDEFQATNVAEHKEQILANLSNFAYDPINYAAFERLNIIDLFLDVIDIHGPWSAQEDSIPEPRTVQSRDRLLDFASGGLCNCCNFVHFQNQLMATENLEILHRSLSCRSWPTVKSTIAVLYYLMDHPRNKYEPDKAAALVSTVATKSVIACMHRYSRATDTSLANLATAFIRRMQEVEARRSTSATQCMEQRSMIFQAHRTAIGATSAFAP